MEGREKAVFVEPMQCLAVDRLPEGQSWDYELKLDGFRCIAFVDASDVFLQSRNGRPLSRYFPELALPAGAYVLDGEIVIRDGSGREDFDALQQRINPAASRIELLARETPARYVVFDLLARDRETLLERPFSERREELERMLGERDFAAAPVELMEVVGLLEQALCKPALKDMLPMQPGDVRATCPDVHALQKAVGFAPNTPVAEGVKRFVEWYRVYHRV